MWRPIWKHYFKIKIQSNFRIMLIKNKFYNKIGIHSDWINAHCNSKKVLNKSHLINSHVPVKINREKVVSITKPYTMK